jgi:hypothetical protein
MSNIMLLYSLAAASAMVSVVALLVGMALAQKEQKRLKGRLKALREETPGQPIASSGYMSILNTDERMAGPGAPARMVPHLSHRRTKIA